MKRVLQLTAKSLGAVVAFLLVAALAFALIPVNRVDASVPAPLGSVADAVAEIERWQEEESSVSDLNPVCSSSFLHDGVRAERVAVLFHGFTNCPAQWDEFAAQLHADGWAVVVPRIPGHGLTSDEALADVTAEEIATTVERSVAVADALGGELAVAGLSSGGVFAAWAGTQSEVDLVLSIAPAFTLAGVPDWASGIVERTARVIPNVWWWWDGSAKQDLEGPDYAYKRFPTAAFGQIGRIGQVTIRRSPPAEPGRVVFLLNPDDPAVNNGVPEALAAAWASEGWNVTTTYFPRDGLPHDVIDPYQPGARTGETYPIVAEILESTRNG